MSAAMKIAAGERGVVRLFAIDLPPEALRAFAEPGEDWQAQAALGAETLDPDFVEIFDAADVAEIGLSQYLIQGAGIAEAEIGPDRARLDGLAGPLMVVTSGAFGGRAQEIAPHAPLRWLGSWHEESPPVRFEPLPGGGVRDQILPPEAVGRPVPRLGGLVISFLLFIGLIAALAYWWGSHG